MSYCKHAGDKQAVNQAESIQVPTVPPELSQQCANTAKKILLSRSNSGFQPKAYISIDESMLKKLRKKGANAFKKNSQK
jgi:hypothetical protein